MSEIEQETDLEYLENSAKYVQSNHSNWLLKLNEVKVVIEYLDKEINNQKTIEKQKIFANRRNALSQERKNILENIKILNNDLKHIRSLIMMIKKHE